MSYHGNSLRKGRASEENRPYLITTVTHQRTPLFTDFDTARLLIRELRTTCHALAIESLAWVVMPDHLHWLFILNRSPLAEVARRVKGRSAYTINSHRNSDSAVWQHGFHDHAIRKEEDIKDIARYIVANPLRAGLVKNIGDYPFWDAVWL